MFNDKNTIRISAPARICLMGEHQDYYGLASITAAINLRISLIAKPRHEPVLSILLPDLREHDMIHLQEKIQYRKPGDYLRSGLKVLLDQGLQLPSGYDVEISSDIPLAKGISSSSAFVVLWITFLAHAAGLGFNLEETAYQAYRAEVLEFNEAGGMMDQYTSATGGLLHIDCKEPFTVTKLHNNLHGFILGDTKTTKDTQGVLLNLKNQVLAAANELKQWIPQFSFRETELEAIIPWLKQITTGSPEKLKATLVNRDLTRETFALLQDPVLDSHSLHEHLARLMNLHHTQLRDGLDISTPGMEYMIAVARDAGALAGKVSGSGKGGFVLLFAPHRKNQVIEAVKNAGFDAFPVEIDSGVGVTKI